MRTFVFIMLFAALIGAAFQVLAVFRAEAEFMHNIELVIRDYQNDMQITRQITNLALNEGGLSLTGIEVSIPTAEDLSPYARAPQTVTLNVTVKYELLMPFIGPQPVSKTFTRDLPSHFAPEDDYYY